MEKWLILTLEQQRICKMSLEHLAVPGNKEVLKKKEAHNDGRLSKGHRSPWKELPMAKARPE